MTPFSIEGASSESRAVHPGSCRCTGHPSRHWPYSSACKPCARLSGLPMGLKCSRPGANSSCPTLRCRTSIRMCRSERQATPKTTTSSSKKSAEPRPGLCPLLSLHPPPAPEPAKNAASPATKRGFSSSLTAAARRRPKSGSRRASRRARARRPKPRPSRSERAPRGGSRYGLRPARHPPRWSTQHQGGQRNRPGPKLIHCRPSQSRLPPLAQYSVGAVAQIWIGADTQGPICRQLPAMHSSTLQPSTAWALLAKPRLAASVRLKPRPRPRPSFRRKPRFKPTRPCVRAAKVVRTRPHKRSNGPATV